MKNPKSPRAPIPATGGAEHFHEFAYQSEPEWSIWAVEAPMADVASALAEISGGEIWSSDILGKPCALKEANLAKMTPVVGVKDGPWVVGFRTVGFYTPDEAELANEQAMKLSEKLQTRAIVYHREAISGAAEYKMFENGELDNDQTDEDTIWEEESIDALFRSLDLYVPACALSEQDGNVELNIEPDSAKHVDSASIIQAGN